MRARQEKCECIPMDEYIHSSKITSDKYRVILRPAAKKDSDALDGKIFDRIISNMTTEKGFVERKKERRLRVALARLR